MQKRKALKPPLPVMTRSLLMDERVVTAMSEPLEPLTELAHDRALPGRRPLPAIAGLSLLESNSVSAQTLADYQHRVMEFRVFCISLGYCWATAVGMPSSLVEFFTACYWEGASAATGDKLLAALNCLWSWFATLQLAEHPQVARALKGWHRLLPTTPRLPLPWPVICGWAAAMCGLGRVDMALALILATGAYMRPGEVLTLRGRSVLSPMTGGTGTMAAWSLTAFDFVLGRSSKVGSFNDSIVLDHPKRQWLGIWLGRLAKQVGPHVLLFGFSYHAWATTAKAAAELVGLVVFNPTLYMVRHPGPSIDVAEKTRTLAEVKTRDRWASDTSVRRYEKHNQLTKQWHMLSAKAQQFSLSVLAHIPNLLASSVVVRPPTL